jgi:hypothetical protein
MLTGAVVDATCVDGGVRPSPLQPATSHATIAAAAMRTRIG